jgi:hypothetical protein
MLMGEGSRFKRRGIFFITDVGSQPASLKLKGRYPVSAQQRPTLIPGNKEARLSLVREILACLYVR